MSSESWVDTTLGTEVDLLTGFPFKSADYIDDPDEIPLVRGDNVAQGRLRWEDIKRWPATNLNGLEKYLLAEGDVVLAMDRPWIEAGLKFASVKSYELPCLLVQRVARLRALDNLDQGFLKHLVGSPAFTRFVRAVETGTAVPHISGDQIKAFRFQMPPKRVQQAIAAMLGVLDDKIELNRQINHTLEAIAKAIFRSWFIDFDPICAKAAGRQPIGIDDEAAALFPDRFVDSELGEIPEGWRVKPLDELADFLNGLALQKFPPNGDDDLPVIKIAELRRGVNESSGRASNRIGSKYIVDDGDLLFSWSGSLEVCFWVGGRGALNQHLFKVTERDVPKWFCYQWICHHLPAFRAIAAGKATTMGHIQRRHLAAALTVIPSTGVLQAADAIMAPLLDLRLSHALENRTLASVRDTLLPELISGRVRLRL